MRKAGQFLLYVLIGAGVGYGVLYWGLRNETVPVTVGGHDWEMGWPIIGILIGAVLGAGCFSRWFRRHFDERPFEFVIMLVALCAVFVGVSELRDLRKQITTLNAGLHAQTYNNIYNGLNVIGALFVEHPELRPYFYERKPWPSDEQTINLLKAVAEVKLEFVDFYFSQSIHLIPGFQDSDGWLNFFNSTFQNSIVLCEVLRDEQGEWGEELLALASSSCPGVKPRHPGSVPGMKEYFPPRTKWGPQTYSGDGSPSFPPK